MPALFVLTVPGPRVHQECVLKFENILHVGPSLPFEVFSNEVLHLEIQLGVLDAVGQLILTKPALAPFGFYGAYTTQFECVDARFGINFSHIATG